MPIISVIIPAYNSAHYLTTAVDSVIAQTFQDFEVLVIDDGSTDETEMVMQHYGPPVRYFRQRNSGVAVARNRGIEESRCRYVAFLDADDTWLPEKLERQLEALNSAPNAGACYSARILVDAALRPLRLLRSERRGGTLEDLICLGNVVGSPSAVIASRDLLRQVGGFDREMSQCADWDMWVRLAMLTEFVYVDEPLATYRQHAANMSLNVGLLEQDSLRVLEKGFANPSLPDSLRAQHRAAFARNYMVLAGTYFRARRYRDSVRCASHAVTLDFHQVGHLINFPARKIGRLRPHDAA